MGRATFWMALGAAALAGGGALYYYQNEQQGTAAPPAQAAVPAAERIVAVEAETVAVDTVLEDIRAVGTLGPDESVVIAPEIAGRIDSIGDTGLAREMAGRIRARTGADAGPPPGAPPIARRSWRSWPRAAGCPRRSGPGRGPKASSRAARSKTLGPASAGP